jgi:hypothetical protein
MLANGTVLAVGGGNGTTGENYEGPTPIPELYDPGSTSGAWTVLAPQLDANNSNKIVNRTYHSTALLLPDGRVLSAGSDTFSKHPNQSVYYDNTFQIFSPPYMSAPLPTISSFSGTFTYGSQIIITTPDAMTAMNIVILALLTQSATTHVKGRTQS